LASGRAANEADQPSRTPQIRKLELQNVGPFVRQEITFDRKWTVLLGDNGVGKTNILRALGIILCGKDAAPYASRIIRSGATHASITLHTDRDVYAAELRKRSDGSAEILNTGARP